MIKTNDRTRSAVHWKRVSICAILLLGYLASGCTPLSAAQPSDAIGEEGEQLVANNTYTQIFWGTLEVVTSEGGMMYDLVDITPVLGDAPEVFHCPFLELSPAEEWLPPEGRPFSYVAGRRYMAFMGYRPGGDPDPILLRLVDLDETRGQGALRMILQATYGASVLPDLALHTADQQAVDEWAEEVRGLVASGDVSLGDVLHVLGPPGKIAKPAGGAAGEWQVEYLLKTDELATSTTEVSAGTVVRETWTCPHLVFVLSPDFSVVRFRADEFTAWILAPGHLTR